MKKNKCLNENLFKINSLMSIFDFFEILCWPKVIDTLSDTYLKDIDQNIKQKIDKFFDNKNIKYITKENLATVIRRFVSRYLLGKRGQNEIKENNNLFNYLYKQELWDQKKIIENPVFVNELKQLFNNDKDSLMISVGQAAKIHNYLGDLEKELKSFLKNENDEEQNFLLRPYLLLKKSILSSISNYWNKKENKDIINNENNEDDENDINRINSRSSIDSNSSDNIEKRDSSLNRESLISIERDLLLNNSDNNEENIDNRDSINSSNSNRNSNNIGYIDNDDNENIINDKENNSNRSSSNENNNINQNDSNRNSIKSKKENDEDDNENSNLTY